MSKRTEYEAQEEKFLAPYAMKSGNSAGRLHKEPEHDMRTAFQRDRDRIVHSNAFRRLEYKTQVFVIYEADYYRTRLTHTIEVAQIARSLARNLGLNEDLVEAIALAHDLGHTPFGHSGEEILNKLMKDHGGFEHNRQSLRIVTLLEKRYENFPGLNLTKEVLDGIEKHKTDFDKSGPGKFLTLEAQVVNVSDEIAYNTHDLDDGIKSELLNIEALSKVEICRDILKEVKTADKDVRRYQLVRNLINRFSTDLIGQTTENIKKYGIKTAADIRTAGEIAAFSADTKKEKAELRNFLFENLYKHHKVVRMEVKHQKILSDLFNMYLTYFDHDVKKKKFSMLPPKVREEVNKNASKHQVICDHIASMTDRYALEEHNKLFDAGEKV